MKRQFIKDLYEQTEAYAGQTVVLGGWVRNLRDSRAFGFIDLNDGSYFKSVQVVFEREKIENYDEIAKQCGYGFALEYYNEDGGAKFVFTAER